MTSVSAVAGSCESVAPTNPRQIWDRMWKMYSDDKRASILLERERHGPRWERMKADLQEAFGTLCGLRAIELGCGRGDLSALLAEHGANVTLLDASISALTQASRRFARLNLEATFEQADLLRLDLGRLGGFDVSVSSGVIEHFHGANRMRALKAHFDVLRPGGMAIVSVPHAHCLPYRLWKFYLERRGCWPYGLEIPYSRRELQRLGRQVGFHRSTLFSFNFWQAAGNQLGKTLLGCDVEWSGCRSRLDHWIGLVLLFTGRRPA